MTDLDSVRRIMRGHQAEHILAAEKASGSIFADWEVDEAAKWGQVADMLDRATVTVPRSNVIHCADGGVYVWDEDES